MAEASYYARRSARDPEWHERQLREAVGHADLVTTARTYTHVLVDETELDLERLLAS